MKRQSGILLHITSLPSRFGIGDLGSSAYQFLDFLVESGQSVWQVLPLNPTDAIFDHSPYSSCSAFAGNPLFISLEMLVEDGLLDKEALKDVPQFSTTHVEYDQVTVFKQRLLDAAFLAFEEDDAYKQFLTQQEYWLKDYARYRAFKNDPKVEGQIYFEQYCFFRQWFALKTKANALGVSIMGDIPIYVNYDSVDVWTHPQVFQLNADLQQDVVAGVPPDYFSATGQRWGNPVYNWEYLQETNFDWWMKRLRHNLSMCDILRIDHFRAFINYWEIPVQEKTAVNGYWVDVPTDDFFQKVREYFPSSQIVAEDLGDIDTTTREKINALGYAGMKILQFAFGGDLKEHMYLPHNYDENCVVYTGTHDNNTVRGWFDQDASPHERSNFLKYIFNDAPAAIHQEMIRLALESKARLAIFPMQDILGLGRDARMNTPGTGSGNWRWRLEEGQMNACLAEWMLRQVQAAGRKV